MKHVATVLTHFYDITAKYLPSSLFLVTQRNAMKFSDSKRGLKGTDDPCVLGKIFTELREN